MERRGVQWAFKAFLSDTCSTQCNATLMATKYNKLQDYFNQMQLNETIIAPNTILNTIDSTQCNNHGQKNTTNCKTIPTKCNEIHDQLHQMLNTAYSTKVKTWILWNDTQTTDATKDNSIWNHISRAECSTYICIFVYLYICIFVLYCPQCSRQLITQGQLPCVTAKLGGITLQLNFVYIPLL